MNKRPPFRIPLIALTASLAMSACQTTQKEEIILSKKTALELRSIQSRNFDTPDQAKVFRSIISVMQDLGYALTSIESEAGVITGNKLAQLNLTASVNTKGDNQTSVRANATVRMDTRFTTYHQVDSAEFYQQRFFDPLSQALFLDALYDEKDGSPKGVQSKRENASSKKKE